MNGKLPEIWDRFGQDAPWNQEDPPACEECDAELSTEEIEDGSAFCLKCLCEHPELEDR